MTEQEREILDLNQQLLDAIAAGDWPRYEALCDSSLTCFEPEARGHLVSGMEFHRFYFRLGGAVGVYNTTMAAPHARVVGDVAVVAYVRLNQRQDATGKPITTAFEETRVWQKKEGHWRHIHFHRSAT